MEKFPITKGFAWKSSKTQSWNTTKQKSASGRIKTLTSQLYPAWEIDVSIPMMSDDDVKTLFGFMASVKGSHEPFLWLDPEENREEGIALVPISDMEFQAVRTYGGYAEPIDYIENVTVYVDGVMVSNYGVDKGIVTFTSIPAGTVTADYTYYWKVCFAKDAISVNRIFNNVNSVSLNFEVVR